MANRGCRSIRDGQTWPERRPALPRREGQVVRKKIAPPNLRKQPTRSLNNQTVGEAIGHEMILAVLFASQDNLDSEALTEISQSLIHSNLLDAIEFLEPEEKQEVLDSAQNAVERVKHLAAAIRASARQQAV